MSSGNSPEVKKMVETAVENYTFAETKNPVCIRLLQDFGLLIEVTEQRKIEMKLIVTEDLKFLRVAQADELELEQLNFSLKKRIRGWFYNPLVKKKIFLIF